MNYKQNTIVGLTFILGTIFGAVCNDYTHIVRWEDKQVKLTGIELTRGSVAYAKELPTPTPTIKPKHSTDVQTIVKIIRKKESGNGMAGLAVTCKKLGQSNEYGYNVPKCYNSHEELTEIVSNWFERKLQKYTLAQALCLYQSGKASNDCEYYQNYLTY